MVMQPGKILVADHAGVYVIKLIGDVRLTLCVSFDEFIETMFNRDDFVSILFDLTEAEAIDSTTLGLMAKLSIFARERRQVTPIVVTNNPSINRILETMGFADIFQILDSFSLPDVDCQPLSQHESSDLDVKNRVLQAHQILVDLNEENRETFRDLMRALQDN